MGKRYFGLQGSARGWLISSLQKQNQVIFVVTKNKKTTDDLFSDLCFFSGPENVFQMPAWDTLPFELVSPQTNISAERLKFLWLLIQKKPGIYLLPVEAAIQKVLTPETLTNLTSNISCSAVLSPAEVVIRLELCGFRRVSLTEEIGDYSVRGGVIDFFPDNQLSPVRLEFFDDSIEKIKLFDPATQRSIGTVQSISLLPVRETIDYKNHPEFQSQLPAALEQIKLRGKKLETPAREIAKVLSAIKSGADFPGMELINLITGNPRVSVFEYFAEDELCLIDQEIEITQNLDSFWELICEREKRLTQEHFLIPDKSALYLTPTELMRQLERFDCSRLNHIEINDLTDENQTAVKVLSYSNLELSTRLKKNIGSGNAFQPLEQAINRWRSLNQKIAFVTGSNNRAERLQRILLELNFDAKILEANAQEWIADPHRSPLVILKGSLSEGVQLPAEQLVFVSENEIFAERSRRSPTNSQRSLKKLLSTLAQLKEGDFLVHQDYGVGRYHGLKHLQLSGVTGDFLQLEYADSKLYLPVQQIGKIQKFIGAEGQNPTLDKLSSSRWNTTKLKVRQSVIALAGDLIKLYAARSVAKGWRFEPKGAEDDRFADGFAYNETTDQLNAINDVLKDLAQDRPMDRLVCGDVGFGKTEVALRAAYKCIQHSRQVAFLAPTTILVEQHKATFFERFKDYPVKIAALSRFYNKQANQQTLAQLQTGDLDIVIGTHKLLQRDVQFKDLGLVIVDEEHRFGVKQKETLKQLKKQVDVLTLTATPIPRTLHMSLLNIRDISIIATAPHDRRTIRTYTANSEPTLIRDAILRELQRSGQVFYIHNRIEGLELVTRELAELVPQARFVWAHGQMPEMQLEEIMRKFIRHEIDVLVSTTIIESGLDIPNANTIIINRADTFGLAQLYQLRGRVGRSSRQAYAYFLIPKLNKLTHEAQQRLKALQVLDDLGQGFNLAIRDLEIRGAGNLLGKEQSGSVLAVGFELYSKILKEAVLNLKGEELSLEESIDPEVKLMLDAYIPEFYVPDISERLILYQRLAALSSSAETEDLRDEIEDRFGPLLPEVINLVEVMRLRSLLRKFGVVKAEAAENKLSLFFSARAAIDHDKMLKLVAGRPDKLRFSKNLSLAILGKPEADPYLLYQEVEALLQQITTE